MTTLWAVDRGQAIEVIVKERDWKDTPAKNIPLSPKCSLLVERVSNHRVMRLSCEHLFRSEAEARSAVAAGVTGWMPEKRWRR